MELLLNLLWVVIALGSFAWWRRVVGIGRRSRGRVEPLLPLVALVCALAILFPAISVTDNLHPELFVAEDGAASRRAMAAVAGAGHALLNRPGHASPPVLLPSSTLPFSSALIGLSVRTGNFLPLSATPTRLLPSRAPPSL
ncbi:MAG: hypothetical protein ACRD3T_07790 [Terriglobia bacterium]